MKNFYKTKTKLAQFVDDQLSSLNKGSVLTTTIVRDISGDYFVLTATGGLWDVTDLGTMKFSEQPTII